MKNHFQITFIVPVYGKDPIITKNSFEELLNEKPEADFIFSYKNSADETLNYDLLNELADKFDNVKVIKNETTKMRTGKILKAIEQVDTKYFQVIDAHHSLNNKSLKKMNKKLMKVDNEYIMLPYLWKNVDNKTFKIRLPKQYRLGAGTSAFLKEAIVDIIEHIKLDVVFFDDSVLSLFYFLEKELQGKKIDKKKINSFHYNRNYGSKISATTFTSNEQKKDVELLSRQSNHMYQIIDALFNRIVEAKGDYTKFSSGFKELVARYIGYIHWRELECGNDPEIKLKELWDILNK